MLDRVMRSGRKYDPGQAPVAPKRRARKPKATEEPKVNDNNGEQTENTERRLITFGSIPADNPNEEELVIRGTGKRKGVAWAETGGVKVSPAVYRALTNRAPPIKPSVRRITNDVDAHTKVEAHAEADACGKADAPVSEREDSPRGTQRATHTALGADTAPDAAQPALRAEPALDAAQSMPGTTEMPETPEREGSGLGLEFDQSGATLFVTARTSRLLDVDSESEEVNSHNPQYIVTDDSPSTNRASKRANASECEQWIK
ncbi:hypothetical protein BN14_10220 [Rhizoctonia solani AG-1 IB]|uniref:Uncharacterized protein n=1 Tax=Thanatephorus cucumeris (strain AG1-IB / isolate 7/3/14) TaxID=1108050 RepID=M5CGG9_THACB|nr:hypothetical protein BN14_10220 [Rhizoctonia solani AG-1 IB]